MTEESRTDLAQVLRHRAEKREQLEALGVAPYTYTTERTHTAAAAREAFEGAEGSGDLDDAGEGLEVAVAGRIVGWRGHGKTVFAHIEDGSGRIQLYFRKDVLGEDSFGHLDLLDTGDWLGVRGPLFRTRTGEVTVKVQSWTLLSKAMRPLPFGKSEVDPETGERRTWQGFEDVETRYRQRYADLAVNPEVREVFRTRTRIIQAVRSFLDGRDFLEVETPALQPLYGGASARPFTTHHNALDMRLYLRIADELYLKRLIVGGFERVYEIAKDFRNEGIDRFHNPEFTMLEFYQAFADYHDMMDTVEDLMVHVASSVLGQAAFTFQGADIRLDKPFARLSLTEALSDALGYDVMGASEDQLRDEARNRGVDTSGMGKGKLMDKLFGLLVQPDLVQPTFVIDHPVELSPLAKHHRERPGLTERFELFVAGEEVANAFSELNDPVDQRARFEGQVRLAQAGDDEAQTLDEDYIRALEYGMPPTGGVGLGIDRLVMMLTDQPSIRDVLLFPTMRPEQSGARAEDEA